MTKVLLTGRPGCGKTTLIKRVLAQLLGSADGFYTQEIRERGQRRGFEIVTLGGERGLLAHVALHSARRVGKYRVDLTALETLGVAAIRRAVAAQEVVVIDEIGPMELISQVFRQAVLEALEGHQPLLATIVWRSTPFTDRIKTRPGVTLLEVRPDNRERLVDEALSRLGRPGGRRELPPE